jgi:predicted DNA-binding transcriptional regulator AlpA
VLPPAGENDALIDIAGVQLLVCMSPSWIHEAVREASFPKPVIRESRCTRWRIGDVRAWLIERAVTSASDVKMGVATRERATHASSAAMAKRRASAEAKIAASAATV